MEDTHLFGLKMAYCLYPEKLTKAQIHEVEEHIAHCERCRLEVEDTKSRADFFRRQPKDLCD
jgi:anti-sigma factor RsiW